GGGAGHASEHQVIAQVSPRPAATTSYGSTRTSNGSTKLQVTQEDGRTFKLLRSDTVAVRVTFLTSRTVRIHALGSEPAVNLPDYIRIKTDHSYPAVRVDWETREFGATFRTRDATVALFLEQDGAVVEVATPTRNLVRNWRINAERRMA